MSEEQRKLNYGGQAVMEGVMMRGTQSMAVAVRRPDGEIVMHAENLDPRIYKGRLSKIPFLRAMTALWDVLVLGIRTLMYSAEVALGPVAQVKFEGPIAWGTVAFSLGLGILLFFVTPLLLVGAVDPHIQSSFLSNMLEGIIRTTLFIGYVAAIGFVPDIRRVFAYHGAEHKTINAYEAGVELTPTSVARFSTAHYRCGTAFMLSVMVISILFFALLGRPPIALRILSRIVFLPLVAGIAYEYIKLSARHTNSWLVRALAMPSLALQKLTTREPDPAMLEVSIAALQRVLEAEAAPVVPEPTSTWDKVADYPGAVL
ncbi:MAG TPA: DUF1385 domain-containing protein [Anaerolineae bacterium]|nr:DUF1385 domain-containing protein [Anaerolineae bacterium]